MQNLGAVFKKYPVAAAYLFGSRAKNRVSPLSDYDFGIQLEDKVSSSSYSDIKLTLTVDLVHALKNNAVDVTILNEAPLLLKYEIFRSGKLLYDRKPARRALLVFETLTRHLDWSYFEKRLAQSLIKKTATEGLNV